MTQSKIMTVVAGALLVFTVGCGSDREMELKINELQNKVLGLEAEIQKLKADEAEKGASPKNSSMGLELAQLKTEFRALQRQVGKQGDLSEVNPDAARQMKMKTREQMRAEANRKALMKKEGFEERRAVAMVRSLMRTRELKDVAPFLNEKRILSPEGKPWTPERVQALVKEHKLDDPSQR